MGCSLKKLVSYLTAVSLMLSSLSLPVFAEDDAAESDTQAVTVTEEETDTGEETDTEEKTVTLEERVAAGLANFDHGMEILEKAKDISLEDTLKRWDDYLDHYGDFIAAVEELEAAKEAYEQAEKEENAENDAEGGTPTIVEDHSEYEGTGHGEIPKDKVSDTMYNAVKAVMPQKYWDQMDQEGANYRLYFIDDKVIVVTEFVIEICEGEQKTIKDVVILENEQTTEIEAAIKKTNDLVDALNDLLDWSEAEDKLEYAKDYAADKAMGVVQAGLLYPAKKTVERLYDVFFAINERNRELAEIDAFMAELGLWNVYAEDTDIPMSHDHSSNSGAELPANDEEDGDDENPIASLPKLIYNLGSGDDTYHIYDEEEPVFAIIAEPGAGQSGNDTIAFEYELAPEDVQFVRSDGDLYINDLEHEVYILIPENFDNAGKCIENVRFQDGTILNFDDICDIADVLIGTELDDSLNGYAQVNHIFGMEGSDTLCGAAQPDDLFGFDGDDTITLNAAGLSWMPDENGKDFAYGMDGNDTIILGGCDDFIWGGKGDDIIKSGSGNDIIYYELGDGNDIIDDTTGRWTYPASGYDVVYLGEGILPEEVRVTLSADSYDFILHITKSGETITLPGNTYSGFTPVFPIEEIHFMDGTTWNRDDFLEIMRTIYGSDGDDSLNAQVDTGVTFYGGDGNDTLIGNGGNDQFYGGKGDDTMRGASGDDTFYYELGDGNDLIDMGNGTSSYPQGGYNVLVLGEGILSEEVTVERSYDDYSYTLWIDKTQESITMTGNVVSGVSNLFPIKEIRFADETIWKLADLDQLHIKRIYGTDGNDSIRDSGDNDTVFCGKGNDYIRGGTGDDLYIYQLGDGCDTILDASFWGSGNNTLQFGEGITMDDLYQEAVRYEGENYTRIYVKDRSSYVQMQGIQNIAFADGEPIVWKNALAEMAPASELSSELTGDLSCDGTISADDVRMLIAYLTNTSSLNYSVDADINQDGVLNVTDLTLLKQICLKSK